MSVAVDSDDEDQTLESLTRSLTMERPPVSPSLSPTVAVCCCGSDSCESLRKTQTMLQDLENQMRIAGTLGKVSSRFRKLLFFLIFSMMSTFFYVSCMFLGSWYCTLPNNRELALSARCLSLLCGFLPRSVNLVPLPQTHTRILPCPAHSMCNHI
jgi:hypothetical protein